LGTLEILGRADLIIYKASFGVDYIPPFATVTKDDGFGKTTHPYQKWRQLSLNKYGFNDTDDYNFDRKPGKVRILVLGDSVAMGTGTGAGDWPSIMEKYLKDRGYDVEVINAAISASLIESTVDRYQNWEKNFQPDIVLFQKDARRIMMPPDAVVQRIWPLRTFQKHSAFIRKTIDYRPEDYRLGVIWQRFRYGIYHVESRLSASSYLNYTEQISRLYDTTLAEQSELVLITIPWKIGLINIEDNREDAAEINYYMTWLTAKATIVGGDIFNNYLVNFGKNNKHVDTVDLRDVIGPEHSELFSDVVHYRRRGNEIVAKYISNQIEPLIKRYE